MRKPTYSNEYVGFDLICESPFICYYSFFFNKCHKFSSPSIRSSSAFTILITSCLIYLQFKSIGLHAKELKLSVFKDEIEDFIALATAENGSHRTLICNLLNKEVEQRIEARRKQRVRVAGFPELKYLQELRREELPKEVQTALT